MHFFCSILVILNKHWNLIPRTKYWVGLKTYKSQQFEFRLEFKWYKIVHQFPAHKNTNVIKELDTDYQKGFDTSSDLT